MTDIIFCEPKSTDYLFFDDENRLHVLVPIVAGESIALDNTCKTHFELKRFFGLIANERSAKTVLEEYLSALTYDIDLLQKIDISDPRLPIKQQRQTQILDYIQILHDIELSWRQRLEPDEFSIPNLPEEIRVLLKKRSNCLSIQMSPERPDSILRTIYPIFSLKGSPLGTYLRTEFNNELKPYMSTVRGALDIIVDKVCATWNDGDIESAQKCIADEIQLMLSIAVDCKHDKDGNLIDNNYLINAISEDFHTLPSEEIIRTLIKASIDDRFWQHNETNLFIPMYALTTDAEQNKEVEKLSIKVQFFLAVTNIYCYANGLLQTQTNFGALFHDYDKCEEIAEIVSTCIQHNITNLESVLLVEKVLFLIINEYYYESLGLTRKLTNADQKKIIDAFYKEYRTIENAEHFDEFMIFLPDQKTGDFFNYCNRISVHLLDIIPETIKNKYPSIADHANALKNEPHRVLKNNRLMTQGSLVYVTNEASDDAIPDINHYVEDGILDILLDEKQYKLVFDIVNRQSNDCSNILLLSPSNKDRLYHKLCDIFKDTTNTPPSIYAKHCEEYLATIMLLELGANIFETDNDGNTIAHILLALSNDSDDSDDSDKLYLLLWILNIVDTENLLPSLECTDAEKHQFICQRNNDGNNLLDTSLKNHTSIETCLALGACLPEPQQKEYLQKNGSYETVWIYAAEQQVKAFKTLINALEDKTFQNNTLDIAKNARDEQGNTLLQLVINNNHIDFDTTTKELIEIILPLDFDVPHKNNAGNTALHLAIQHIKEDDNDLIEIINLLIEHGARIHVRNNENKNSLDLALENPHPRVLKTLLLHAITLPAELQKEMLQNMSDGIYDNVLMYALSEYPDLVKPLLLKLDSADEDHQKSIVNASNKADKTPLMFLTKDYKGSDVTTLISKLLDYGADINYKRTNGNSALHLAVKRKDDSAPIIALHLLEQDQANIYLQNNELETSLELALKKEGFDTFIEKQLKLIKKNYDSVDRKTFHNKIFQQAITTEEYPLNYRTMIFNTARTLTPAQQKELLTNLDPRYDNIPVYLAVKQTDLFHKFVISQQSTDNPLHILDTIHFDKHLQRISRQYETMLDKAREHPSYNLAVDHAKDLIQDLVYAKMALLQNMCDIETFQKTCQTAIAKARPVLKQHRNWPNLLKGLLLALILLPVSVPLYAVGFFSLKTKSAQLLDALAEDISHMKKNKPS